MKKVLKDWIHFVKHPKDQSDPDQKKLHKAKRLFSILLIDIILMGLLSLLINLFDQRGWVKIEDHQLNFLLDYVPLEQVLLLVIFIIPFIEEMVFRFFLRYQSNYFLRGVNTLLTPKSNRIEYFWHKYYFIFFYSSAILFAGVHIVNYDLQTTFILIIPILILPQFLLGVFIGYLRVRYSFMLGFWLHALHNGFFILLTLLPYSSSGSKLEINHHDYSLKIEEVGRSKHSSFYYFKDSFQFVGTELKMVLSILADKDEYLLEGDRILLKKKVNLSFNKHSNLNIPADSLVLQKLEEYFQYNMVTIPKIEQVYILYVADSLPLKNHYVTTGLEVSNMTVSGQEILLENVTLELLAKELSTNYSIRFESQDSWPQTLNFKLPNKDFSLLEEKLKTEYGIKIKETEKIVEYLEISKK